MGMRYYPLFLDLTKSRCLVVGAGSVGRRKIASLLECRPLSVLVVDPNLNEEALDDAVAHLPKEALIKERRAFCAEDAEHKHLVFAATPSAAVNSAVAELCRARGVLCNVAGPSEDGACGSFIVPAHVENGPITLTLSTSGCSPALAKALKEDLEQWIEGGYAHLALLLKALRPKLLALGLGSDANAEIFRALCAKPLRDALMDALIMHDAPLADRLIAPYLPADFCFSAKEIFHGLD